jgi:hypothetical protein
MKYLPPRPVGSSELVVKPLEDPPANIFLGYNWCRLHNRQLRRNDGE